MTVTPPDRSSTTVRARGLLPQLSPAGSSAARTKRIISICAAASASAARCRRRLLISSSISQIPAVIKDGSGGQTGWLRGGFSLGSHGSSDRCIQSCTSGPSL